MDFKKITWGLCASLTICGGFSSCSDDDEPKNDDNGSKIELPASRVFILNEGSIGQNNANISLFDPDSKTLIEDVFYEQNEMRLGDVGQDMIEYNDYIYVSVYKSNYIARLNAAGVEQERVSFTSDPDLQGGVRYLAAEDGYLYASFYGGVVAKINATSLRVEKKITGLGANLEGVAIENDMLYVANAYEQTVNPETGKNVYNYFTDLRVIDLRKFELSETLTVAANPNQVLAEDGKIFLISWGNYKDQGYEFQMIDPKQNNKVTSLGVASKMGVGNDKVYLVYALTDWTTRVTTNTFSYYDIKAGKMVNSSFINDPLKQLENASIYSIGVNDENGDIYIGLTNYTTSNGSFFRFKKDGSMLYDFANCGGQNPSKFVFIDAD